MGVMSPLRYKELAGTLESFAFPNGLSVVFHHFPAPSIGFAYLVRAGPALETPQDNGISHFLEHMLFRGVPRYPSSEEFTHALDRVGAEANAATFTDLIVLSCRLLPECLGEGLTLFKEMVASPVFAGLDAEREIILEELLEDFDEDGTLTAIDQLSSQLIFRNHPYALPILGNRDYLRLVTQNDLMTHLRAFFHPSGSALCLSGNFDPKFAKNLIGKTFGKMPRGEPEPTDNVGPVPAFRGPQMSWVDSPRSQIQCRISFRGYAIGDSDFALQKTLARLLDNPSGSPLRQAMQDEKGFCYSLGVSLDGYAKAGALHIDFTVKPERLIDAVFECLRVLAALARKPPSEGIVEHLLFQYVKGKRFAANDPWDFCGRVGFRALFPGAQTFAEEFEETQRVRPSDIQRIARRLFRPKNLGITLVGPWHGRYEHRLWRMLDHFPG